MTNLSVNINKIALLRNSRPGNNPSPLAFAKIAWNMERKELRSIHVQI